MARTFEELLTGMLDRIPDDLNKEADSPVYIAVAPVASTLAEQQVYNENIFDATMPDTARGEEQTRIYTSFGIPRYMATPAIRRGVFMDENGNYATVPLGARFGAGGIAFFVLEKIEAGVYKLECEVPGIVGNNYFGAILSLDNDISLGNAELEDILVAGVDDEDDETYRARFEQAVNTRITSGNVAWYEQEIRDIPGVGDVKVFPTPNGEGGRVHAVIVAPGNAAASGELLDNVKNIIDPEPGGSGSGKAPIDHSLSVSTVLEIPIDVSGIVWILPGYDLASVNANVEEAITAYLKSISFSDDTVRIAAVEAEIMNSKGVLDVQGATINGSTSNIRLLSSWNNFEVPSLGELRLELGAQL